MECNPGDQGQFIIQLLQFFLFSPVLFKFTVQILRGLLQEVNLSLKPSYKDLNLTPEIFTLRRLGFFNRVIKITSGTNLNVTYN